MGSKTVMRAAVLAVMLAAEPATGALAHKGKLPEDALTLVQQASALLAQNPGMTGEVKERLQAALKSKKPEGVDLQAVSAALQALDNKDTAGARRLLMAAITPPGMPKPPRAVRRAPAPSGPSTAPAVPPAAEPAVPPPVDVAMKMAEPLQVQFARSTVETVLLAVSLALIGLGLTSLWRSLGEVRP